MIKRFTFAAVFLLTFAAAASAQEHKEGWQFELNRIALNLTTTQVKHASVYQGFPDSRLNADTQTLIQGIFNFNADHHAAKYLWANNLLMEYGKSTIEPSNGNPKTETENTDRIILTSDIAYKLWQVQDFMGGFDVGPFANASYETEFTAQDGARRKKVLRGRAGIKAFEGKYLKSLYGAGVFEEDFTYNPDNSTNFAWETGFKIEQPIREGVKAVYGALFRDYVKHSKDFDTNIDYEFEASARMDVLVWGNLAVAPFINYYLAKGEYREEMGQNLYVGVSLSFSKIFKEAKKVNN